MDRIFTSARLLLLASGMAVLVQGAALAQQAPAAPQAPPRTKPVTPDPAQAAAGAADDVRGGWRGACVRDVKQFCRTAAGGKAKRQCLEANNTKISAACQTSLNERRQVRAATLQACGAEVLGVCKDAVGGTSAKLQCLQLKTAEVSPACNAALTNLAAGGKGGKAAAATKAN